MSYEAWMESLMNRVVVHEQISPHQYAQWLEPGVNLQWVLMSSAYPSGMDSVLQGKLVPTIKEALTHCRSGENDVILVLPGHQETIDSAWATNLVSSTKIIGLGDSAESNAPQMIWNATGSTIAVDDADVTLANFFMKSTANGVTNGITVTAAGFKLLNNRVQLSSSASDEFTDFLELGLASDRALVAGNTMLGVTGPGDAINIGAISDSQKIIGNKITGVTTHVSTAGLLNITAAATNLLVDGNDFNATLASSTACVYVADVAATGVFRRNTYAILAAGTATNGFVGHVGASYVLQHFENYVTDPNVSGILTPAAT